MTAQPWTEAERPRPRRRCAATGERGDPAAMVRFVRGPDDTVVPDLAARLPGRGVWIAARREAVERARAKGAFQRGLGAAVKADGDIAGRVEALLAARVLDMLGLARRAGAVGVGFEAVRALAGKGAAAIVFAARDGAPASLAKLAGMAGPLPVVSLFDALELGQALGCERVVQVAVKRGGAAKRLAVEAARLAGFRALGDDARLRRA